MKVTKQIVKEPDVIIQLTANEANKLNRVMFLLYTRTAAMNAELMNFVDDFAAALDNGLECPCETAPNTGGDCAYAARCSC